MDKNISAENFIDYAVNTYSDTVYRVALNITHNSYDSFDISQEVFIRLVKSREKIKDEEHLLRRVCYFKASVAQRTKSAHKTRTASCCGQLAAPVY